MPSSPGCLAGLMRVSLLAAATLYSFGASAQERCSGTFCDLYYGGPPPEQPAGQPAAPTPLIVPNSGTLAHLFSGGTAAAPPATPGAPAPARPLVGVGGGGLAAMARGAPAERCSGTFCDLYYGGPPPEPAAQPATAAPQGAEGAPDPVADPASDPDAAPEPAPTRRAAEQQETPRCASPAQDPWRCYR